jgi:hypothetical protein
VVLNTMAHSEDREKFERLNDRVADYTEQRGIREKVEARFSGVTA